MYERQENDGLSISIVFGNLMGDLAEVRLQSRTNLTCAVIPVAHAHVADIQFQRDHLSLYRAQIFISNGL